MAQSLYVAPDAAGLARTPYLTLGEFKAAPSNVDTSDLVPGGTQAQNDDALLQVIARASSEMDRFVHYVLAATRDTEQRRVRVQSNGYVRIPLRGIPLLELDTFVIGATPSTMTGISGQAPADIWHEDNILHVPVIVADYAATWGVGSRVFCRFTYVNGYANTVLANGAYAASGTSVVVQNSLGFYAGKQFTIYDSQAGSEVCTVAGTYVGGLTASTTIPLAAPLLITHTASATNVIAASALPPAVKDACVHWTAGLVKSRGGGAMALDTIEASPTASRGGEAGGLEDIAMAEAALATFVLPSYG